MIAETRAAQKDQADAARAREAGKRSPERASARLGEPRRVEGAAAETMRASRGAVDAPGKRHRKPPPQEVIGKRMGEPVGKQMGQKSVKNNTRRGRIDVE